jgi:hypothetical protein
MSSIFFGLIFATWGTKKQIGCENPTKDFYFFSPEKWPKFTIPFYHGMLAILRIFENGKIHCLLLKEKNKIKFEDFILVFVSLRTIFFEFPEIPKCRETESSNGIDFVDIRDIY